MDVSNGYSCTVNCEFIIRRNGRQIYFYLVIPSIICGIALLFCKFNPIGDQTRLDFVINMLLAIILLLLVITA